jgi:hypothetical protein
MCKPFGVIEQISTLNAHRAADRLNDRHSSRDADFPFPIRKC